MGKDATKSEWLKAKENMARFPVVNIGQARYLHSCSYYQPGCKTSLDHSFLKLQGKLLCIGSRAGAGNFGAVNFAKSQGANQQPGRRYAVKIMEHAQQNLNEANICRDVGVAKAFGMDHYKQYLLMADLGRSLDKHLDNDLTQINKFEIAIKLCDQVAKLHSGFGTISGNKLVHRDIKPANVMFNTQTGDVRLTDYGLSENTDPNNRAVNESGTPPYLPYYGVANHSHAHLDSLALMRTIFMPHSIFFLKQGLMPIGNQIKGIFSLQDILNMRLYNFFDTSKATNYLFTPLEQGALLILASMNQFQYYQRLQGDVHFQRALNVLCFSDDISEQNIININKCPNYKIKLSNLWPLTNLVDKKCLKKAMLNKDVYSLLLELQKLPRQLQFKAFELINQNDNELLNNKQTINIIRGAVGLNLIIIQPNNFKFFAQNNNQVKLNKISPDLIHAEMVNEISLLAKHISDDKVHVYNNESNFHNYAASINHAKEVIEQKIFIGTISHSPTYGEVIKLISKRLKNNTSSSAINFNEKLLESMKQVITKFDNKNLAKDSISSVSFILNWFEVHSELDTLSPAA